MFTASRARNRMGKPTFNELSKVMSGSFESGAVRKHPGDGIGTVEPAKPKILGQWIHSLATAAAKRFLTSP